MMPGKIKLPFGGFAISMGSDQEVKAEQEFINKRAAFTLKYMKEKGWGEDIEKLSIDQLMEIRDQPEWKNPE
jgi:hypothetical protein